MQVIQGEKIISRGMSEETHNVPRFPTVGKQGRVVFGVSDKYLAWYSTLDGVLTIKDLKKDEVFCKKEFPNDNYVVEMIFIESKNVLIYSNSKSSFSIMDLDICNVIEEIHINNYSWFITKLVLTQMEDYLIVLDNNDAITIYDTQDYKVIKHYSDYRYRLLAITTLMYKIYVAIERKGESHSSREYFVASMDIDMPIATFYRTNMDFDSNIWTITTNQKDLIMCGFNNGIIRVFDTNLTLLTSFQEKTHLGSIWYLGFVGNSNHFVSGSGFGSHTYRIHHYDIKKGIISTKKQLHAIPKIEMFHTFRNYIIHSNSHGEIHFELFGEDIYTFKESFHDVFVMTCK